MRASLSTISCGLAWGLAALLPSAGPLQAKTPDLPAVAPLPTPAPENAEPQAPPAEAPLPAPRPSGPGEAGAPKPQPDPRSAETEADRPPPEETACRERLKALGAVFQQRRAEHDPAVGCSLPYPVVVTRLGPSIALAPAAELNCAMAEASARFMASVAEPAARKAFGKGLKAVEQASAYVCRPRHNGRKLSEHAFGDALDIAAFVLEDGTRIEVGPSPPPAQAAFLAEVRQAACGPFNPHSPSKSLISLS